MHVNAFMLLFRCFVLCFSLSRKIVIACNNGLFSVKHKVMSKCAACTPFGIATPTKFVQMYVPFNSLVHFLDCFAWFGLVRFAHVVVVVLFSACSISSLVHFVCC